MKKSKIDIAVLLIFFTRTEKTLKVFEQIRLAKPSKLYLYQDGPRKGHEDDVYNINQCRRSIESRIDWDCEVHRWYREDNIGCDPSEFLAQKWMFSTEDKGIILEDDDIPSLSFFPYCKELLDKYENDNRINIISGQNVLGKIDDCPNDYFFSTLGPIWGWATWKRTIDAWDDKYEFLNDKYTIDLLLKNGDLTPLRLKTMQKHSKTGKAYYETILASHRMLNNKLNIIPKYNLISNIGVGDVTTHTVSSLDQMPKKFQKLYYQPTFDLTFPLNHPKYVILNKRYTQMITDFYKFGFKEKIEYKLIQFKQYIKKSLT